VHGKLKPIKDSKFVVNIEPMGFWQRLLWYLKFKSEYQCIPYFMGTRPKVKLVINSLGKQILFDFILYKKEPDGDKVFSTAFKKIRTPTYSEIVRLPDLEHETEHIYCISVWAKTDYGLPETHKNIMHFTPFDRDRVSMKVLIPLVYGLVVIGFGAVTTWIIQMVSNPSG